MKLVPLGNGNFERVPEKWSVLPLRRVVDSVPDAIKMGPFGSQLRLEYLQNDGPWKVYGQENVIHGDFSAGDKYVSPEKFAELKSCEIKPGDIVITMMGTAGRCAVVPPSAEPGIMDSHLVRLRLNRAIVTDTFAALLLDESKYVKHQLLGAAKGSIMQGLNSSVLKNILLAVPPITEQQAIVSFLHSRMSELDSLIVKEHLLIQKLKEKRAALISRTVTRGLPPEAARAAGFEPNPKVKPAGIEWLGEVPEHWELPALGTRFRVELGKMLNEERVTGEFLVPYLRNIDVQWNEINFDDLPEMNIPPAEYQRYTLKAGDLLVCEGGDIGRAAIVPSTASVCGFQKALHRLRPRSVVEDVKFMYYVLRMASHKGVFLAGSNPNTIDHLTAEKFRRYRFPRPPATEQRAIADFLDRETAKIDSLVGKIGQAIERLLEYRTALITAAVTGRIRVGSGLSGLSGLGGREDTRRKGVAGGACD